MSVDHIACGSNTAQSTDADSTADASPPTTSGSPAIDTGATTLDTALAGFDAFAHTVTTFTSGDVWMVECNGIPIFNALNNRGDDAFLVGELDEFGGHCGRADDYHYHAAPLHLEALVGAGATITEFDELGNGSYRLVYTVEDAVGSIDYTVTDTTVSFEFTSPTGDVTTETYTR